MNMPVWCMGKNFRIRVFVCRCLCSACAQNFIYLFVCSCKYCVYTVCVPIFVFVFVCAFACRVHVQQFFYTRLCKHGLKDCVYFYTRFKSIFKLKPTVGKKLQMGKRQNEFTRLWIAHFLSFMEKRNVCSILCF